MNKKFVCFVLFLFCFFVGFSQEDSSYIEQPMEGEYFFEKPSMFGVLWTDFKENPFGRKEKLNCYFRYTKLFFKTAYWQVSAPVGYIGYYMFRKKITLRLEELYKKKNLSNIENVGKDIISGLVTKEELKEGLGNFYYQLWLYGDTDDPIVTGGVPEDYKPNKSMFWRRWFYSGLRNPKWNATYINHYTKDIVAVKTVYDTRQDVVTHNYGTSDTRLGMWFRWYVDSDGKWWFFYENTKRTKKNKGKVFYFGAIGFGQQQDGIIPLNDTTVAPNKKKSRFEFSLNRSVWFNE